MTLYIFALCCGLTAIEMIGAIFAERSGLVWVFAGMLTFVGLFFLYKESLSVSSLTMVTIGWIFTSQFAAVAVDYWVFGKSVNRNQFIGMIIILVGVVVMCVPQSEKENSNVGSWLDAEAKRIYSDTLRNV